MESTIIIITVLIMASVITAITLGEINKLAKENKDLQKTLEAEQQLRESEAERYETMLEAQASKIKEEEAKRQEAERKLKVAEDRQIEAVRVHNPLTSRKRLSYTQAIKRYEVDDLEAATRGAEEEMIKNVLKDLQKYVIKEDNPRYGETIYRLDIWV